MRFRPSIDETMLSIAGVLAFRATCQKLAVGCVLTDEHNRILATGYNGVPRSMTHCIDKDCGGAYKPPGSDTCIAVHAEQNALLQCPDPDKIVTCYVTHVPCMRCMKTLLNTSTKRIVVPSNTSVGYSDGGADLWYKAGRTLEVIQ